MASSYPGALDTFTDMGSTLNGPPTHSSVHAKVHDALEAIQAELGTDPAGASATVKARLDAMTTATSTAQTTANAQAKGLIAYSKMSGTTSVLPATTTTIPDSTVTFTAESGRYYRIRAQATVKWAGGTIPGALILADGSNTAVATCAFNRYMATNELHTLAVEWVGTLTAGSVTRLVRLQVTSTNSIAFSADTATDYITVEDLGAV